VELDKPQLTEATSKFVCL